MSALDRPQKDIFSKEFLLGVSMGLYPAYSIIDKFGENPLVTTTSDPEDTWEGGGVYTFDQDGTAPITSFASTSALDTGKPIEWKGLDINGNEVIQKINTDAINGTTRVPLTTPLWRVNVGEAKIPSSTPTGNGLNGTIITYTGTGTVPAVGDANVRAILLPKNKRTQMALYTIPKGKVGFLLRGEFGLQSLAGGNFASNATAVCKYLSRRYGMAETCKKTLTVTAGGASIYQDERSAPDVIPALTDVKLNIDSVSNDVGIWGTFDILLVDETEFSNEYLTAIGQVGY